tara:strand:- start:192 stop:401 length:210 start_codon:yes stop_codon:yes gene_type:complete
MFAKTNSIIEDATNHMNQLVNEHKKIHEEIEHNQYYAPDALLTNLKKKKLKIKDEIEVLRNKLQIISRQ